MGKKVNECKGDRMSLIGKGVINDVRDIEYFFRNIKEKDYSFWFRVVVDFSNFKIADKIIDLGYVVCEDEWVKNDVVFLLHYECQVKIDYLISKGLIIDYYIMKRVEEAFITLDYVHTDIEMRDLFKKKCQNKNSCLSSFNWSIIFN